MVEVYSALNRRTREGQLSSRNYRMVLSDLGYRMTAQYHMVELTLPLIERTRELLERHALRAYDAIQLASALTANDALVRRGQPEVTFLCADQRLLAAARAEGLPTDDPNAHP